MIPGLYRLRALSGAALLALAVGSGSAALLSQGTAQPSTANPTSAQRRADAQVSATLHGDKAHPAKTQGWVDTELFFGLGPAEDAGPDSGRGVSEADWRAFLDKEVTPRFPAGLSVVDVYGQWQGKEEKAPERIRSKMLMILYPKTAENEAAVEAIRQAWKVKTGDQSVLRVSRSADVSF